MMHISSAEAMLMSKLTGLSKGDVLAREVARYLATFSKNKIPVSSIHPVIMQRVAQAAQGNIL